MRPLPSEVLSYLEDARTMSEIERRFGQSTSSEVLDTMLYLAGRREIIIDPGSNGRKWIRAAAGRAHMRALEEAGA